MTEHGVAERDCRKIGRQSAGDRSGSPDLRKIDEAGGDDGNAAELEVQGRFRWSGIPQCGSRRGLCYDGCGPYAFEDPLLRIETFTKCVYLFLLLSDLLLELLDLILTGSWCGGILRREPSRAGQKTGYVSDPDSRHMSIPMLACPGVAQNILVTTA
jgi:hypothetical protein